MLQGIQNKDECPTELPWEPQAEGGSATGEKDPGSPNHRGTLPTHNQEHSLGQLEEQETNLYLVKPLTFWSLFDTLYDLN